MGQKTKGVHFGEPPNDKEIPSDTETNRQRFLVAFYATGTFLTARQCRVNETTGRFV